MPKDVGGRPAKGNLSDAATGFDGEMMPDFGFLATPEIWQKAGSVSMPCQSGSGGLKMDVSFGLVGQYYP
jgi:hypothetical protein